jgi:Spy/CpxP family protein refolding chaperone
MRTVCRAIAFSTVILACTQLAAQELRTLLVERFQDLNLTDEQEAAIANIQKEDRPKVEAAAQDLAKVVKEEVDKVKAVLTPAQREKLADFREDRKELRAEGLTERIARVHELDLSDSEIAQIEAVRKECRPQVAKAMEGLRSVLNDDQRKAREVALESGKKHREVLAALNLTDAQKEKVLEACRACRTAIKSEMEKISDVLTPQQQEKVGELRDERKEDVRDRMAHRIANFRELDLTQDQIAKISEIRKEYRPRVHEAGNKLRAAVREELHAIGGVLKG